jgi:hypothetical protein
MNTDEIEVCIDGWKGEGFDELSDIAYAKLSAIKADNARLQRAVDEAEWMITPLGEIRRLGSEEAIVRNALLDAVVRWLKEYGSKQ